MYSEFTLIEQNYSPEEKQQNQSNIYIVLWQSEHTHSSITVQPHSELIYLYKPSLMGKRETRSIANPSHKSCTILSCSLQKSTAGRDSPNCCHLWIDLKLFSQYFCSICNIHSFSQDTVFDKAIVHILILNIEKRDEFDCKMSNNYKISGRNYFSQQILGCL